MLARALMVASHAFRVWRVSFANLKKLGKNGMKVRVKTELFTKVAALSICDNIDMLQ